METPGRTKWERERILAQEEIAQIERERAVEDILLQMKLHGIQLDELRKRGGLEEVGQGERKTKRRISYDPIFGWR